MNEGVKSRRETLALLMTHKPVLTERFGVVDLVLFGSIARDQATKSSDVDILVRFNGPATAQRFFGAQFYLEELLGCPVDLATEKSLRPELRPYVEADASMNDLVDDSGDGPRLGPRQWRFYVEDMAGFCERVLDYTAGLDQAEFVAESRTHDAAMHNIILIGEAATHVPDPVREMHPEVPWGVVTAARNRIIHGYLSVDDDIVWSIIQDAIPALLPQLRRILETTGREDQ